MKALFTPVLILLTEPRSLMNTRPPSISFTNHSTWYEPQLPGQVTSASFIGIVVAISGNVLISLALNCQKLAHIRLERDREAVLSNSRIARPMRRQSFGLMGADDTVTRVADDVVDEECELASDDERTRVHSPSSDDEGTPEVTFAGEYTPTQSGTLAQTEGARALFLETEPLLVDPRSNTNRHDSSQNALRLYGARSPSRNSSVPREEQNIFRKLFSPFSRHPNKKSRGLEEEVETGLVAIPADVDVRNENRTSHIGRPGSQLKIIDTETMLSRSEGEANEGDYLKSKLWWFGFLLMNVGEMGNFISYAFAPASVVAPLGSFALIANCVFAPLMLKEAFRGWDFIGVGLSVIGAVTVVLSANPSDTRLKPSGLIQAIKQPAFIALAAIYVFGVVTLVGLSSRRVGREHVFVDVGACALFGGFTVLSTKAFSSLLTLEWWGVLKEWITYPVVAILVGTGIGQIKYLNRALMKFDGKVVIPTQFVLFNLSAIVGSAVLYGDFRYVTLHQMVTFLYGCGATFTGVYVLTTRPAVEHQEEVPSIASGQSQSNDRERADRTGRAQIVLPATPLRRPLATPILRGRASTVSFVGLSPAQRVLLVRTSTPPPSDTTQLRGRAESVTSNVV